MIGGSLAATVTVRSINNIREELMAVTQAQCRNILGLTRWRRKMQNSELKCIYFNKSMRCVSNLLQFLNRANMRHIFLMYLHMNGTTFMSIVKYTWCLLQTMICLRSVDFLKQMISVILFLKVGPFKCKSGRSLSLIFLESV